MWIDNLTMDTGSSWLSTPTLHSRPIPRISQSYKTPKSETRVFSFYFRRTHQSWKTRLDLVKHLFPPFLKTLVPTSNFFNTSFCKIHRRKSQKKKFRQAQGGRRVISRPISMLLSNQTFLVDGTVRASVILRCRFSQCCDTRGVYELSTQVQEGGGKWSGLRGCSWTLY